jgi:hypothetical protein
MKLPKEKFAVAAREAKRRLENPLIEAPKAEKLRLRPSDYVRFNERHIEIARDLELRRRDEALRGLKG